jgi:hypothetical protein
VKCGERCDAKNKAADGIRGGGVNCGGTILPPMTSAGFMDAFHRLTAHFSGVCG